MVLLKSREDLSRVIQDLQNLDFKPDYGFKESHSNFYNKIYRVIGEPFYIRSSPFSKKVLVIEINDQTKSKIKNETGHSFYYEGDGSVADLVFDLEFEFETLALLEKVNLIKWTDEVVRKYVVALLKKHSKTP